MTSMINQFLKDRAQRHLVLKREVDEIEEALYPALIKYVTSVYNHSGRCFIEKLEWRTESGQPRLHLTVSDSNRGEWTEEFYEVPMHFFDDPDAYIVAKRDEQVKSAEEALKSAAIAKEENEKKQLALLLAKYPGLKP